jgi:hypothetical protein
MEVVERQSEPQPNERLNEPQQSEPNTSQAKVKDKKRKYDNLLAGLTQTQVNGLILKSLSRMSAGVTSVTKNICVLSSKMDKLTETFGNDFCMT